MNIFHAIFLGFVQGFTEFFPVSSSGHLTLFQEIFGLKIKNRVLFDIFLHFGTLLSVIIVFRKDIVELIKEFFYFLGDFIKFNPKVNKNYNRRLIMMLISSAVPLVFVAIFKKFFEEIFDNLKIVGMSLVITGILIWFIDKVVYGDKTSSNASFFSAFLVGLSQVIAVIPGLSRSGITIFSAVLLGYKKKFAIKFSFLMSIIAICGAMVLELSHGFSFINILKPLEVFTYFLSVIASCISGIFAIKFFTVLMEKNKFHYFSYYCLIVGTIVTLYR
ncbi:MAG: undecaprenyl-diphosphate phosphatase [Clostridiales bacterium]|jgi:undecaprenyl-diphosphatase|nr:undecaprenyl-diphosphate phosphatase [Clostridiales bacterium]